MRGLTKLIRFWNCNNAPLNLIRREAPDFSAMAWHNGEIKPINFRQDYANKYVLLFFYPLNFTFVCPTEIIAFNKAYKDFKDLGCEIIGCSVDSHFSHMEYTKKSVEDGGVGPLQYPLVADFSHRIATAYGALCTTPAGDHGLAFRATALINKAGIVKHFSINDLPVGRNPEEYLRILKAFQFVDQHGEVCPANWKPGQTAMKPDYKSTQYKDVIKEHANK